GFLSVSACVGGGRARRRLCPDLEKPGACRGHKRQSRGLAADPDRVCARPCRARHPGRACGGVAAQPRRAGAAVTAPADGCVCRNFRQSPRNHSGAARHRHRGHNWTSGADRRRSATRRALRVNRRDCRLRLRRPRVLGYAWTGLLLVPAVFVPLLIVLLPWAAATDLKVALPARAMGHFFAESFERRTGRPLAIVTGDPRTAALIAVAAP